MKRRILLLVLAAAMLFSVLSMSAMAVDADQDPSSYGYDETDAQSVTVNVTVSHNGMPLLGADGATVLSSLEVKVPYFDLGLYGLQDYYRYGTDGGQGPYVNDVVIQRPTGLHLYIYLLERYYMGLPEEACGQGTSGVLEYYDETMVRYLDGSDAYTSSGNGALSISGSATSLYMTNFWGHSENLMYYRNHRYPLIDEGWGATCDYTLLSDGDTIDLAMFSNWNFYMYGYFACFNKDTYTVNPGQTLEFCTMKTATSAGLDGSSSLELLEDDYFTVLLFDESWNYVDIAEAVYVGGGSYTMVIPEDMPAGEYQLVGLDSYVCDPENACVAPAASTVVVEEAAKQSYLSDLRISNSSSSTAVPYAMTPAFSGEVTAYTVEHADNRGSLYMWATLSDTAPEGSAITAAWTSLSNGSDRTQAITSGKSSGQYLNGLGVVGTAENQVTVTVGTETDYQVYTIDVKRTPTLSGLSVEGVTLNEAFVANTTAYTAETTADAVTVHAVPYDAGYTVTYNGAESSEIALNDGANVIEIVVANAHGAELAYTLTVTKVEAAYLTFDVSPADAVVLMTDKFGTRLWPNADGAYEVMVGVNCTYTVTAKGYVGQTNTFAPTESGTIEIVMTEAAENAAIDPTIEAEWANFRNGENHLGITDALTPYAPEDAELLWAGKYGTGWSAAPGSPILVDNCLVTYVGSTIKKLDLITGEIVAEGAMVGSSSFSIVPATYADGMIFVGLSGGRIQAFNADTLESLWVYTDKLGGQPNCPITYKDGYVYAGFWNGEAKNANFAAVSVTDEDPGQTTETKLASWVYTRMGGFYWAGAYATENFVVVGTDDGASGYNTLSASLVVLDCVTGAVVDTQDGIRGDIRSNVSYDPDNDRVFFTSKGGVMGNARIDWETGEILDYKEIILTDANGSEYVMSTCTPSVHNDRIYIGTSGNGGNFSGTGFSIAVYDLAEDGAMTKAYAYAIKGYPQTSAMVSTGYEEETGCVYIYLPYNNTPGGIAVLKDKKGQTEPLTTTDAEYSEVFTPVGPLAQYAVCSTIADQYGTIYYKNDSCYMMAVTSKILSLEVTQQPAALVEQEDGVITAEGLKAVVNLKNGLQRDVSDYLTVEKDENGVYWAVYTYGFDNESYGLKTQKAKLTVEEKPFDLYGTSMTLEADLTMNFYVEQIGDGWYAEITRGDDAATVSAAAWEESNGYYRIAYTGIAAKEMTDEVTVVIYDAEGNAVSNVYTDSVRAYAMRMLAGDDSIDELKTALVDMLNYGAAAQTYFGYKTGDLANSQLTEEQKALATESVEMTDSRRKGDGYVGTSLSLESKILLNFYFDKSTVGKTAVIRYTDHYGSEVTDEVTVAANGSMGVVVVQTLAVADASQPVTVQVLDGETVAASAVDSVESYCARMGSLALREPLMKFAVSACSYFGAATR